MANQSESDKVMPAFDGATAEMLPDKDKMYFNDYATLVQQQGMLQDHVRTSIYQFAVYENKDDFRGKRVLDVGAGTGILSFFAAKAGASRVYAVEASGMALKAEKLAAGNGLQDVVTVLNKRVEDVTLDEKVDLLISEPLGIALVNERMIESYIVARDTLLKPGGKMYPDHAVLHAAPFCDEALYNEQTQKAHFWAARDFYGIDLAAVQEDAHNFYFSQPVVGHVPPHTLLSDSCRKSFDFNTMSLEAIQRYTIKVSYRMAAVTQLHGVALWFDCRFPGSQREVFLSTAPHAPLTHWYQVRCLLRAPLPVGPGHTVSGTLRFEANESRGYNLHLELTNDNTGVSAGNTVVTQCALHHFQYTSQQSMPYDASYGAASGSPYCTAPSYPGQNAAADEVASAPPPATGLPV